MECPTATELFLVNALRLFYDVAICPCSAAAPDAADAPAAAAAASIAVKQKRTPEDIAYEGVSFLVTSLRTFFMGTAKAVHSPARRREEQAAVPTVPMKAAALNLALLLVGNFQLQPWQQYDEAAEAKAGFAASGMALPASSKPGGDRVEAATMVIRSRSGHYIRLTEELNQVLFDNRRRYCHLLVLNYFAALGGMKVSLRHVQDKLELLTVDCSSLAVFATAAVGVVAVGRLPAVRDKGVARADAWHLHVCVVAIFRCLRLPSTMLLRCCGSFLMLKQQPRQHRRGQRPRETRPWQMHSQAQVPQLRLAPVLLHQQHQQQAAGPLAVVFPPVP